MKTILGMILASMLVSSAFAQTANRDQAQMDATQPMTETPPIPGKGDAAVNPKDPKKDDSSGAIVRKHDTPMSLDPAKKGKAKKIDKKKPAEPTPTPHVEPKSDSTESTD